MRLKAFSVVSGLLFFCAGIPLALAASGSAVERLLTPLAISSSPLSMPEAVVGESKRSSTPERLLAPGQAVSWSGFAGALPDMSRVVADQGERRKRLQIGWPQALANNSEQIEFAKLKWTMLADGSQVALVQLSVPEAAAFRAQVELTGTTQAIELRLTTADQGNVYRSGITPDKRIWTDAIDSATGLFEIRLAPGQSAQGIVLHIRKLSHRPFDLRKATRFPPTSDIGTAGACNYDIACVSNASSALLNAAKATVRLAFVDPADDREYACSGTLINAATPGYHLYTAAHCIDSQAEATSLITTYFFDAVACDSLSIPPYQSVGGGATLLFADDTMDGSLLRLAATPPAGAVLASWDATVIPKDATIVGLHHPQGDLKKFSQGTMLGYAQGPTETSGSAFGKDSYIIVRWSQGTTEAGSSGSGAFTYNSNCSNTGIACYQLRGGLEGGGASCETPTAPDRYSRMDLLVAQMVPYLLPDAVIPPSTASVGTMVEFYNPQFDYYFMTSREFEKSLLGNLRDGFSNPLWYRTQYWFKVDPFASSGTSSLIRYLIPGAAKSGTHPIHFYTVLGSDKQIITNTGRESFAANCAGVPNLYFCNEGIDSFIAPPIGTGAAGTCLAGERRIYRVFRGDPPYRNDGNHRYLTDAGMYGYMVNEQRWIAEHVAFCAQP